MFAGPVQWTGGRGSGSGHRGPLEWLPRDRGSARDRGGVVYPLIVEGKPVGVLNLYSRISRAFSATDRQLAALLAGQAAIAVTAALRHYDEITLSSRSVIDQAIGIVI